MKHVTQISRKEFNALVRAANADKVADHRAAYKARLLANKAKKVLASS